MRELGRAWAALAALGAGLMHLGAASRSPLAALVPLALLGAAELAWAVLALVRHRAPVPHAALAVALAASAAWGVLAVAGGAALMPADAMAGATALDLAAAALLAARRRARSGRVPGAWPYLAGLVAGGLAVAAIVTLCLGAGQPAGGVMPGMGM